jgi:hypothetical protein
MISRRNDLCSDELGACGVVPAYPLHYSMQITLHKLRRLIREALRSNTKRVRLNQNELHALKASMVQGTDVDRRPEWRMFFDDAELAREALAVDECELDAKGSGPRCGECGRRGCFPSMR